MHKLIVSTVDLLLFIAAVPLLWIAYSALGVIAAVGVAVALCLLCAVWSLLRVIQGELEALNKSMRNRQV